MHGDCNRDEAQGPGQWTLCPVMISSPGSGNLTGASSSSAAVGMGGGGIS